ncbi:MAG: hypothetical protein A2494_01070 [Candidatus Lloydbacteria bacterium RIFOXYC12_FULL_46_25]|uniref:AAA+ ATPase domain-containing protein n=1 Tax=Candidatus Lloydbacteria bacterium RIFOXYC12_FULL_46_25 TaxID=1798670 RepID=A0A1G2E359_9BACT|nr:MAG: hypothetical protein A2494_01070 [Candidatus Lloydbacteria bacterium RIFOXYC12_FULL_46_25]
MKQSEALQILKMGHNAFITGAAGSGKTHLLNEYIAYLKKHGVEMGITASTGIAATHMGGMTIHAWSGLGIRDTLDEYELDALESRQYLWKRMEHAKVLIIDEISMLHHFRIDLVDKILRAFKRNDEPFGGIQVVLCGDFFQLPPVSRYGEPKAEFVYKSDAWKALDLKICYLEEQHRQTDPTYLRILNDIRENSVSEDTLEHLESRYVKGDHVHSATKLYSHNIDVDSENEKELAKIPGELFEYEMAGRGKKALVETMTKGCLAPHLLRIKENARVMFVKNNFEMGYANGTLGTVVECGEDHIVVETNNGDRIDVAPATWMVAEEGEVAAEITQFPLRLAWAITVHKSQGMSLDAAEVDLSSAFERGMGYVALSRVRTLDGLMLKGLNGTALRVHDEVLEFDGRFREDSEKHADEMLALGEVERERFQEEFLASVAPSGKRGKKVVQSTREETRQLLDKKLSLEEIATMRGLKKETIITHIEELRGDGEVVDVLHLKNELPAIKLKKILATLEKMKGSEDEGKLTPAKRILGDAASFEEIRIARLFL